MPILSRLHPDCIYIVFVPVFSAAFLIAYLVLQFLIGKPMYFMELVIGQYSGLGPTGVWKMNPSAKGKEQ
jgi:hypothetical protein